MTFSLEQIKASDNLYAELGNSDALVEHLPLLNNLTVPEQREIALKLISSCPDEELKTFAYAIRATKVYGLQQETFHDVLSCVFEVRKRTLALLDSRNPKPYQQLIGDEFSPDLFVEFNHYALELMNPKANEIATKLALSTPKEHCNEVARNLSQIFPCSELVAQVHQAFTLRKQIDLFLLGSEPFKFFISPEFSAENYLKFDPVFELISYKDEEIAAKLSSTPKDEEIRALVLANMELIFPKSNLLEKTRAHFNPARPTVSEYSLFKQNTRTTPESSMAETASLSNGQD